MNMSLEVLTEGKLKGNRLPITLPQFLIGRDPQCHLRPASPSISKRHCAILQRDNRAFVRDFDSTNGTFVNDRQIKGEIELQQGDRLRIGPIIFTVHLEAGAPVNRPTPPPPTKNAPTTPQVKPQAAKEGDKTPMPPTKQPPKPHDTKKGETPQNPTTFSVSSSSEKDASADDDIAAMLLEMGDESSSGALGLDQVPEGSTVMDLTLPPGVLSPEDAKKEKDKEKDKPKPPANTQSAAKEILEKYMKRPR
jgi:pSer/pThr/pTyr-binding forkhead associated (FHA) protein